MDVIANSLNVLDEGDQSFFNQTLFKDWVNMLYKFSHSTISILRKEIGNVVGVSFEINYTLLQEVVYDAIIGLKTIVVSENNTVESPNPFKIAAHLAYWFVRHKPIIFRAENKIRVDDLQFASNMDEAQRKAAIVEMKHLNEVTAARFMLSYIFQVDCKTPVCNDYRIRHLKKAGKMHFDSFPDMFDAIYDKLTYHLTYREISPKILEHFLEAYTLHPYLPYTTDLWNTEKHLS